MNTMLNDKIRTLKEVEREHIENVLNVLDGNKTAAARALGLDRRTLYRKIERWGRKKS